MAIRWPWYTDPVVLGEIAKLNTKMDQVTAAVTALRQLVSQEVSVMTVLSDKIDAANVSADAAIGRVQTDVSNLAAEIVRLQALVDAGGATPTDLANLDSLKAKLDALDPTNPAVLPTT